MFIRIKYKSAKAAEEVASKLPISCDWRILRDRTTDAYLEVPESYEDYILKYLNPKDY